MEEAAGCAWAMVTIKLPDTTLQDTWEPIIPRLLAEIGGTVDSDVETEEEPQWPWAVSGLGTAMGGGEGMLGGEDTNWADQDVASPGIEIRSEREAAPLEFESLSLRTSHGGIRLTNIAWLTGNGGIPAVIAHATAGAIVAEGLSAAADTDAAGHIRGRLSFWAKEGDAKVSRVRVSVR